MVSIAARGFGMRLFKTVAATLATYAILVALLMGVSSISKDHIGWILLGELTIPPIFFWGEFK